ncbi:MAG TPA: periplasmic heavy metal sensor [Pyrinomonadaceae bacterium]|jgi:Spy/CpxP family protein refolding chaperone|nr:periplasmic heavy metal sensor [Pyrinomonadaceae bacterium]
MRYEKHKPSFIWLAAVVLSASFVSTRAQTAAQNQSAPQGPQNNVAVQPPPAQNLPAELNFTPQQIQQWREINRELRSEEMPATLKLREARLALNEAMESANPNEEVIKQRAKELADAQSAVTQLQALRQARVLKMLTPEQRIKLKEIRERVQTMRREQQNANAMAPNRPLKRNGNALQLTPAQRKALRQQQPKQKR